LSENCEKNTNINTSVNLKLVDFLSYVKANRDSVGQTASPIFKFINDVKCHIVKGGIFMHIKEREFQKSDNETD
jgi:hypothetical protein